MKKLLYTLLLGLLVISCDKSYEESVEAPLAIEQEMEADILNDFDINGLIDRLVSSTAKNDPKGGFDSAKDAVPGESYIKLFTGSLDGNVYEFAWDDVQDDSCGNDSGFTALYLCLNADSETEIKLSLDGNALITIERNFSFLYQLDIKQGIKVLPDGSFETASVSGNTFTF